MVHQMRTSQGAPNDPVIIKNSSRFHTGPRFHQTTDPARERADISPQVARAAGHTRQAGRRRRIDQWQLDLFSVFISKTGEEFSAIRAQI